MPLDILDDVRIASPCSMRWEDMTGGDRVRFCAACQKNVFNLSAMKRDEAVELLRATEGRICGRIYKRADGTVLTNDCPVGLKLVARRAKRAALGAVAASLGAVAAVLGFLATSPLRRAAPVDTFVDARAAVVDKMQRVEEQHSALVVPQEPMQPVAGGLSIAPIDRVERATPPKKPTAKTHEPQHKMGRIASVKPPPAEVFMGDVDIAPTPTTK